MMMGFGLLGLLLMILLWIGLIVLAVWLVGALFRGSNQSKTPPSNPTIHDSNAREILDTRYVRGEITRDQYELMRSDLNEGAE